MKIKGVKLFAALAIALCTNGLSYAGSYKVGANVDVLSSRGVFHARTSADNLYSQVSALRQQETSIYGEGPFAALNKKESKEDTTVVGVDMNGHSLFALEKLPNGGVLVSVDMLLDDVVDGMAIKLEKQYKAPAQFTQGSWESYQAGSDIELQLTEEGEKIMAESATASVKDMLRKVKDAFAAQLQSSGAEFGEVTLDKLVIKGGTVIKGNSSRLEVIGAPTTIEMGFMVNADF